MALLLRSKVRVYCALRCIFLLASSCLSISLAGCANSCFVVNSNPPTGTVNIKVSDSPPSCTATTSTGAVRVLAHVVSPCSSCSGADQVRHIFISLRGIALREPASVPGNADEVSSNWQEFLLELGSQPLQVDLMNSPGDLSAQQPSGIGPAALQQLGQAHAIPAGTYRQLRLLFVPNQPGPNDASLEKNACGTGFNCVVLKDGRVLPFAFDGAAPELHVSSGSLAGGSLLVLPDTTANLVLDFHMSWILSHSDAEGVRLVPALSTTASLSSQSHE